MAEAVLRSVDGIPLDFAVHEPAPGAKLWGTVIQAHGITVDMDEGGMFVRLADRLAAQGFTVLRFSYRGHGHSGGTQDGVTIAGEMLDLQAAVGKVADLPGPVSIVAASFGAVSTTHSLYHLDSRLGGLVFWCPVLDLRHTFIEPELPWGLENFGPAAQTRLDSDGYLLVDGEFKLGRVLFEEMRHYGPCEAFAASSTPALIVHGNRDTYVSYDIAQAAAAGRSNTGFYTVDGSDHGFDSREREDEAIKVTVDWLVQRHHPQ